MSSVTVASGVVGLARIAHETAHVADEVGAVVKAGITVAAQAEFVLVMLLRALLFSQFEAGSVLFGSSCHGSSVGSSSPSRGSSRHCSFVRLSMSQVATIWTNVEKVFQFYSADSVNRWIMIKVKKIGKCVWPHVKKRRDRLYVVFICVTCQSSPLSASVSGGSITTTWSSILARNRRTRRAVHASA